MAFAAHDGVLRTLVHEAKYGGHASIARALGRRMRPSVADLLAGADGIVPVPLHPVRRLQRGFNQAEVLAQALGVPVRNVLRRRRWTRAQAQLTAARRRGNVAQAFALAWRPWRPVATGIRGQVLVLVDDVRTTGATLDACAAVLRQAGAAEVRALVVARAELTHSPERGQR